MIYELLTKNPRDNILSCWNILEIGENIYFEHGVN